MTQTHRKRRSGWFSDRVWRQYWIETRTICNRVELHALHLKSGHRFIAKADRLDVAAANLIELIHGHAAQRVEPRPRLSKMQRLWKQAMVARDRMIPPFKPLAWLFARGVSIIRPRPLHPRPISLPPDQAGQDRARRPATGRRMG